jgi:hypothetical protein
VTLAASTSAALHGLIVRRPLTQLIYSLPKCPFRLVPLRSSARPRPQLAILGAALDALPPSPDTILLSTKEATEGLR